MSTVNQTKFWVVCCEENEATQQISQAIEAWQLPGVRSLLTSDQSFCKADTIAHSDYAIFITPYAQPCSQIKVSPLSPAQATQNANSEGPATLLSVAHERHGQSPQSWWLQLPTTEVRARQLQPVSTQKSVAQALSQIEVFVRNYRLAVSPRAAASRERAAEKQLVTA
ncbi:MAG: hypothetical protein WBC73_19095 [Phormidesmis sp.]